MTLCIRWESAEMDDCWRALGNTGALLAIDGRGVFAQLAKAGSAQITGIVRNAAGKIFLCTANPGN